MSYIDTDKLIAEIKRRESEIKSQIAELGNFESNEIGLFNYLDLYDDIRSFITSLQQEQPDNWDDEYREDELLTRFAFYTYKDEDGVLYLSNVFVEETSRNKGFGAKILQAAEKVAETIGAITIRLKAKRNSQANDWYRKHGYGYLTFEGEYDWLEKNLEYLKSKQEQPEVDEPEYGPYARQYPKSKVSKKQPEVDLEEYIENEINHYGLSLYKASYGTFSASEIDRIIRNAFEFGLNAKKKE